MLSPNISKYLEYRPFGLWEPFFENIIVGCFVRIGIAMSVKNVDAIDPDKKNTSLRTAPHTSI